MILKKRFGLKRVYDKKTSILTYRARWWLYYVPTFIIRYLIKKHKNIKKTL